MKPADMFPAGESAISKRRFVECGHAGIAPERTPHLSRDGNAKDRGPRILVFLGTPVVALNADICLRCNI